MKREWKITLILKCGKEIPGIFRSEHADSSKVYDQIARDMVEHENEIKWMTILVSNTEVVAVRVQEIAAIRLGV